MADNYIFCP